MNTNIIFLKPRIATLVNDFLTLQQPLLFNLVSSIGSPIHLLFPQLFSENVNLYSDVFSQNDIEGEIYYSYKSNKAQSFLEIAAYKAIGVEVSSIYELRQVLGHGISGKSIIVSGPSKDNSFLLLGIQQGCLIAIDNFDELLRIEAIIKKCKISNYYFNFI